MEYSLCGDFLNSKKVIYPFLKYGYQYLTEGRADFMPWAVEVHPTAKCNHRCIHCSYKERNESRAQLDERIFDALIDSLISMNVKGVYFSGGGEPSCYPNISTSIEKLNSHGIEVAMVTNGSLLESQGIIEIADRLNYIAVSVPSCDSETFERITGRNYVDRILRLPEIIKSKHGASSPVIGARVVITNLIVDEVQRILEELKKRQYDYALFKIVRDYEDRGLGVSDESAEKLMAEIDNLKNNGEIDHQFTNLDRIFDYRKPYKPEGTCHINKMGLLAVITPEGDVYNNISEIGKEDFLIGNLYDDPLDKIWNSERHNEVKKNSELRWQESKCMNCRAISYNERINTILADVPQSEDPFV